VGKINIRKDDSEAVLNELGLMLPSMLRESVDDGFYNFTVSRRKDPDAYTDYTECTRGNMLYDRIASAARILVSAYSVENPDLSWRISSNKRATDILLDTRFAFRLKRTKKNRRGCTTSVSTHRQRTIKSSVMQPIRQMVLPFPADQIVVADAERIWITVGFDLDDAEESIAKVDLGIEVKKHFLWTTPLHVPDVKVIANISPALADKITELRIRRTG